MFKNRIKIKTILLYAAILTLSFITGIAASQYIRISLIPSDSMAPTLKTGDMLINIKSNNGYQYGDIVSFTASISNDIMIKRIIAFEGDDILVKNGTVTINGEEIIESYIAEDWSEDEDDLNLVVPEGCLFVMGDNRLESFDSRHWADEALSKGLVNTEKEAEIFRYVKEEDVVSKAVFRIWPLNRFGPIR